MADDDARGLDSDDVVAEALAALGSPVRLRLLRALRLPKTLGEIEVSSGRAPGGASMARQSVREHLDRLMAVGVVASRGATRAQGATTEFVANHQSIFALSEEVRRLARLRAAIEPPSDTVELRRAEAPVSEGPRLVVVKGLDEGLSFPLRGPATEWTIGRRRGLAVSLDFDPYVSAHNAIVSRHGDQFSVRDLPETRNGTSVNFQRLAPDERRALRHGDIIGVGSSLLVYWT